jgi:cyanophycin synthetase
LSCNKYFLRQLLKRESLPTPLTVTLSQPTDWIKVLESPLRFPLVVKPIKASHANGATLNIIHATELKLAVARAFAYNKKNRKGNRVLVEEFFSGHDLRFLVVGNHVTSVVKRNPAYVIGNGHNTIGELARAFSKQWQATIKYDYPLCPIRLDGEVTRYLNRKKLTLETVPPKNKKIFLRWNANVSTGGRPSDVTDEVHPKLKQLAVRIARLSQLEIGGVDILCKDIASDDLSKNNISILEINDSPGIDIHHFPYRGQGHDVAGAILNYIFKITDKNHELPPAQVDALLNDLNIRIN